MNSWEWHQCDGSEGPFGYYCGWFVAWKLIDNEVTFELEFNEYDQREGTLRDEHIEEEETVRAFVEAWLAYKANADQVRSAIAGF